MTTLSQLNEICRSMIAPGKGVLAADECAVTMASRFKPIGVESTLETRREYRTIAFTTPGLSEYVSGVILQEETLKQAALDGTLFVDILTKQGMVPGINVDLGLHPYPGSAKEFITDGLDGLTPRLEAYRKLGAKFAKWRALIAMGEGLPTLRVIKANAQALARYSAACQAAGLVPIVEPEVAMDGTHTLERCKEITELTLRVVFEALAEQDVKLEGILLKTNMVLSGADCRVQATDAEVAKASVEVLKRTVPPAVPGVIFLSGGQSSEQATARLAAINALETNPAWPLSYAYGRAFQSEAFKAWGGKLANRDACQKALMRRGQLLAAARFARYSADMEK